MHDLGKKPEPKFSEIKKQTNVQFMPATVSLAEIYSDSKKELYYGQIFDRGKKKDWLKRDQSCSQVQCYYCLRDLSLLYCSKKV